MELLILSLFCSAIFGSLLGYVIYKNHQQLDEISKYNQEQDKKKAQRHSNRHF